jgi:predicted Zn-dependent protease
MCSGFFMVLLLTFYAVLNMSKALIQLLVLLALFFSSWFLLSKVDFMRWMHIDHYSKSTEKKLGDLIYTAIAETETEETDSASLANLQAIKMAICTNSHIDTAGIKLHLIKSKEVNAFALPDGHLVVYTGLIAECENAEELCGVLGHEIGHIEHHHVMKKLLKEVGLSVLITTTTGKDATGALRQLIKLLSSTAYDRKLEAEADIASVDYLIKAKVDPTPFANILYRLGSVNGKGSPKEFEWISTHPDSEKRAKDVLDYIKTKKTTNRPLMLPIDWEAFKARVQAL